MPWYQTWNGNFVNKTSAAEWKKCMNDSRVITLEDRAAGWNSYTAISTLDAEKTDNQAIYDLQGRHLTEIPSKGFYIKGRKKYLAK